jgi:hypothetical protein
MPKEIAIIQRADRRRDVVMPYAPAIVVRLGDLVFLSGVTAAAAYHRHPHREEEFDLPPRSKRRAPSLGTRGTQPRRTDVNRAARLALSLHTGRLGWLWDLAAPACASPTYGCRKEAGADEPVSLPAWRRWPASPRGCRCRNYV